MAALDGAAERTGRCYLTGGATAVLLGWRGTTIDVDLKLVPEQDAVLRAIPGLKDELQVNVELAAPGDFIPLPAGWEERSLLAEQGGRLAFYHFDPYAQALAKLERDHARDRDDVRALIRSGLVDPQRLRGYFEEIEPLLYRFPAIDPPAFRERVEQAQTIEPGLGQGPDF
ncbi:MAG TPA: DUF6036 family nucleotidyltransferase [Gaiellaceae bacterium]|nr:DUF6036 family nucleotidyltransferase [Gaiellaceae bacterium]